MSETQPDGFLANPASGKGPGVLVLHPWWGLNETIRQVCTRLADHGFTAFAPDLYHGKLADTIPGAEALAEGLDHAQAHADVQAAVDFLAGKAAAPEKGVAAIGFSLGAFFALDISTRDRRIRSVVLFYGVGPGDFSQSQAAYLGHFAENDTYESPDDVAWLEGTLAGAGRPVTFHHYPGVGHWFFEPDRTEAFNQAAAQLAWERTLDFLNTYYS